MTCFSAARFFHVVSSLLITMLIYDGATLKSGWRKHTKTWAYLVFIQRQENDDLINSPKEFIATERIFQDWVNTLVELPDNACVFFRSVLSPLD